MEIRGSMAMHFPFELDTFQKEAICNLEMVGLPDYYIRLLCLEATANIALTMWYGIGSICVCCSPYFSRKDGCR